MRKIKGFSSLIIVLIIAGAILTGEVYCFAKRGLPFQKETRSVATKEEQVGNVASIIVGLLKNKDSKKLADYVHPTKKLRLSPYANITPDDILLSSSEVEDAFNSQTVRTWGIYDGLGQPIELSFTDYYEMFIYDKNFADEGQVSINNLVGQGNTLVNTSDVYPEATFVEYYVEGNEEYGQMDWASLILVFEKEDDEWYLVGIVHNGWTI